MAARRPIARFLALSDVRKAAEVAQFDRETEVGEDGLPGKPLSAAQKKAWGRAKRKMGRPRIGKGARRV